MHPWKIFSFYLFSLEILLPETIFRPSWIPTTNPHLHLLNARILQCSKEFPSKVNETSARNSQTVTFWPILLELEQSDFETFVATSVADEFER